MEGELGYGYMYGKGGRLNIRDPFFFVMTIAAAMEKETTKE